VLDFVERVVPVRLCLRGGTFAPFSLASLSPMATACLRLVTRRPELLSSVPFFRRRIADATVFEADFPYFAIWRSFPGIVSARRDAWRLVFQD
jgi:hypothetical protein